MKLFKIFLGVFISIYSSVLFASVADVIDKCKDVKPEEDYDLHIFSVDKMTYKNWLASASSITV